MTHKDWLRTTKQINVKHNKMALYPCGYRISLRESQYATYIRTKKPFWYNLTFVVLWRAGHKYFINEYNVVSCIIVRKCRIVFLMNTKDLLPTDTILSLYL